jgi:DNA modification methylase
MYIYNSINLNICGNTLENQKVVGTLNGVTVEIEKFTQNVELFTFGSKSMEICQKDMKSIISTLINLMIELKTYNVLKGVNIDFYTQDLLKTINLLMELKTEDVNFAKNTNNLLNLLLEMVEHIKVIVNLVQNQNYNNGEKVIENITINTTENIERNSRFFYTAKSSKGERNKGLEEFDNKPPMYESHRANYENTKGIETPYAGTGRTGNENRNNHPTVKPIKLMQYLVRLITPPNGIVLDPFNGSGTTGIAAKLEGFNYVGLELDIEYCKISEARIAAWELEKEIEKKIDNQLNLF